MSLPSVAVNLTTGGLLTSTPSILTFSDVADEAGSTPMMNDSPSAPSSPSSPEQAASPSAIIATASR